MKGVGASVGLQAPGAARGVEGRVVSRGREVDDDRAGVVEEAYDVASRIV